MRSADLTSRCGTVTALQSELFEVSLISCVRTEYPGFLSGIRESNVAVTRGRQLRVIVGNAELLSTVELWREIISCPTAVRMEVSLDCGINEDRC